MNHYAMIASAAAGAILTAGVAFLLHSFIVNGIKVEHALDLKNQALALNQQCDDDKALTREVSNGLQQKNRNLSAQLDRLKRVQPDRCIVPAPSKPPGRHDAAPPDPELSGQNGVTAGALYDFAADAEQTGLKLDACQSFILKTWQSRGYNLNP
jgi:hypothetical protein